MFRLPASGLSVALRQPTGSEELLLREKTGSEVDLALSLIERIAWAVDGNTIDWSALTITDLETLLLRIRQAVLGDTFRAEAVCTSAGCHERVDIAFSAEGYLSHHVPRRPKRVEPAEGSGWFRIAGEQVTFRLPNGADLAAVAGKQRPDRECLKRCVDAATIPEKLRRRVEAAMEAMAPSLSHDVQGQCPECGRTMNVFFDVLGYVLRELRDQAEPVYRNVHLLAFHYKWPEETILALPRSRRMRYAEMLMQEEGLA